MKHPPSRDVTEGMVLSDRAGCYHVSPSWLPITYLPFGKESASTLSRFLHTVCPSC
jgi:hypothetical protein